MRPVWWNRQEDQHRSSRSVALFRNDAPLHFDVGSPLKRGAKAPFIFVFMCSLHNCTSTADSTGVVCIRCVNYCPMDGLVLWCQSFCTHIYCTFSLVSWLWICFVTLTLVTSCLFNHCYRLIARLFLFQAFDHRELHPLGGEEQNSQQGLLWWGGRILENKAHHTHRGVSQNHPDMLYFGKCFIR